MFTLIGFVPRKVTRRVTRREEEKKEREVFQTHCQLDQSYLGRPQNTRSSIWGSRGSGFGAYYVIINSISTQFDDNQYNQITYFPRNPPALVSSFGSSGGPCRRLSLSVISTVKAETFFPTAWKWVSKCAMRQSFFTSSHSITCAIDGEMGRRRKMKGDDRRRRETKGDEGRRWEAMGDEERRRR